MAKLKAKLKIKLDWEHTDSAWIDIDEIKNYDTVPKLFEVLEHLSYK